jgi:CBS domain-containing protein
VYRRPWDAPEVEIAEFLRRYPPFSHLAEDRLARIARAVEIEHFPEGATILRQDGPPADALYVIRKGAVELLDDGEPLDLLGEGEVFGQFSLLAHGSPSLTARAREDSLCYLLAEPLATEALETEAGRSFLSSTLRTERWARSSVARS